jgi:hypothetical protein
MVPGVARNDLLLILALRNGWVPWFRLRPGRTAPQTGSDAHSQQQTARAPAFATAAVLAIQLHRMNRTAPVNQSINVQRRLLRPECSDFPGFGTSLDSAIYEWVGPIREIRFRSTTKTAPNLHLCM